uniref:Uncharacterized protein n=1 Tax=Parascaris equorum TaxID=6256 RepID=A0A914RSM3_PAREQ
MDLSAHVRSTDVSQRTTVRALSPVFVCSYRRQSSRFDRQPT